MSLSDTTVSLHPYFAIKGDANLARFKTVWKSAFEPFAHKSDCVRYSFTFTDPDADGVVTALCNEAYTSAETTLQHLGDVDAPLKEVLSFVELDRLEVHGPAGEIEKLRLVSDYVRATRGEMEVGQTRFFAPIVCCFVGLS